MKFNKDMERHFLTNVTLKSLMELITHKEAAAQITLNATTSDHRYLQGYRQALEDIINIYSKATNR